MGQERQRDQGKMKSRKNSIIFQVAVLFVIGTLLTSIMTYKAEQRISKGNVRKQTEIHAQEIAEEVRRSIMEYPAHEWLIRYWYEHADEMDIEYDALFGNGITTEEKSRIFNKHNPQLQLRYLKTKQVETLPEGDQKFFAEIAYSWLITRIDEIKQTYHVSYLFAVVTQEPFDEQFFLFSGADPGAVRGTRYEEVYPLGHTVTVAESQQDAMRRALLNSNYLADAGNYLDYYRYIFTFDGRSVLIGLTYDLSGLLADVETQTRSGTFRGVIHQLLLALICMVAIFMFVLAPLKNIQYNIRHYKKTKDSSTVVENLEKLQLRNELGELAVDLSEMALEIDAHVEEIKNITAEQERISAELSLAKNIQTAMLPHIFPPFPERREIDLYAIMDPAKEVGGDFYDYFLVDDDHLCMVIADVSGKGVPAALFMMVTKIIIHSCAAPGMSAGEILTKTNEEICSNNPEDMFVTVWVGILELSTGKLCAANAGHEYPVFKKPGGCFELLRDKHGFVVGGMEGVRYKEYEMQLEPWTKLFVYTDGVTEATSADNKLFGTDRMLAALNREADETETPDQILRKVRRAIDSFVGDAEQFDDLTMLCLEYRGTAKDA